MHAAAHIRDSENGRRLLPVMAAALLAMISTIVPPATSANADQLRVHGSTTFSRALMEPFQKVIEELSGQRLNIIPNKSTNGVIDLIEGRADVAMISSSLAGEILSIVKLKPNLNSSGLVSHPIAETRVAFVVHPSNSVTKMTLADIARVLQGDIRNWRQLGGADLPIRTVYVRTAGGVTSAVQDLVLEGKTVTPALPAPVDSPVQVAKIVAQEPSALGLSQLRLAKEHKLRELSVGQPVVQHLALVTKTDPSPAIQSLIRSVRSVADKQLAGAN